MRALAASLAALLSAEAAADASFAEAGQDLVPRERAEVAVDGFLRVRAEHLYNFDLDRGLTPSGRPLFAVPLADPTAQGLSYADARLRADVAVYAPGGAVAVKMRADLIDDFPLGGAPELTVGYGVAPTPAASPGQRPLRLLSIKRAYGEAVLPIGVLSAGRMGAHWGLGMLAGGGDCLDCNGGDAADRIAFVTPVAGHLWAVAYDFGAIGPTTQRVDGRRAIDLEPSDDVRSLTFAVLNWKSPDTRLRRRAANKATFEYGASFSLRAQENDVPAHYLPAETPVPLDPSQLMRRGYRAGVFDGWARFTSGWARIEAEAALMLASVEQVSLVPGVLLRDDVRSTQLGAAVQSAFGSDESPFEFGLDFGFASGDPAPGFGAYPPPGGAAVPGEMDAPQASLPRDTRIDNFRFHPDYRIDRILFAEILGTVTDAAYVRPHARYRFATHGRAQLTLHLAAVASRALFASSTPGGRPELGVEVDSALAFTSTDGLNALLEHAFLFPLAGLANPDANLSPTPAQLVRLRLAYVF